MENEIDIDQLELAVTNADTSAKEASENLKQARAYSKAMRAAHKAADADAKDAAAADVQTAKEAEDGWKAAVAARKEELKLAKAALRDAKKKPKAPKVEMPTQNGMTQPRPGTSSDTLWNIYSATMETKGSAPALDEVVEEARTTGIPDGTIKAAYAHWRKFHGITGRIVSAEKLAAKEAAEAEKAEKAAAREAAKAEKEAAAAAAAAAKADAA